MMVDTIYGPRDESTLEKREGFIDNDHERAEWIEYWAHGEMVHRSMHVHLKTSPLAGIEMGSFS